MFFLGILVFYIFYCFGCLVKFCLSVLIDAIISIFYLSPHCAATRVPSIRYLEPSSAAQPQVIL